MLSNQLELYHNQKCVHVISGSSITELKKAPISCSSLLQMEITISGFNFKKHTIHWSESTPKLKYKSQSQCQECIQQATPVNSMNCKNFHQRMSSKRMKNETFHLLQSIINTSGRLDLYSGSWVTAINTQFTSRPELHKWMRELKAKTPELLKYITSIIYCPQWTVQSKKHWT